MVFHEPFRDKAGIKQGKDKRISPKPETIFRKQGGHSANEKGKKPNS